jgi:osmotically-inducible protein OsmY
MLHILVLTIALSYSGGSEAPSPLLPPQADPSPNQATAGSSTRDYDRIEDLVRVRLAGNRDTGGAGRIKVTVKDAVVTLSGKVESDRQKSAAEKQTKKVKGVKGVNNQLTVEPRT